MMKERGAVPEVKNWLEGRQGDWVKADDGGIVQILKQKPLPHPYDTETRKFNGNGWCRTVVGTFRQTPHSKMDTDFALHPNRYRFGGSTNTILKKKRRERDYLTNKERLFCLYVTIGKSLQESIYEAFGRKSNWLDKALELLKREKVMDQIRKNTKDVAKDLGITEEWILGKLKELASDAKSEFAQLNAIKELEELINMKADPVSPLMNQHQFVGFDQKLLDEITKEEEETIAEVVDE